MTKFNVLSLGAGVQSTCVFHRSGLGELPKLDAAVFADTGWERTMIHANQSKEAAFAERSDERNIPIRKTHSFKFSRKWFKHRNQKTWSTFLPTKFSSDQPVNMIQIGVWEGMDLVWCLQNILGHRDSRVLAIDPWEADRKHTQKDMDRIQANARHNLRPWRDKVRLVEGSSQSVLEELSTLNGTTVVDKGVRRGEWDLIVIDGDHRADAVYEDARLSVQLIRPGGWLLFDDVRNQVKKKNHVADGIRMFLSEYPNEVELAWFHRYCNCYERV